MTNISKADARLEKIAAEFQPAIHRLYELTDPPGYDDSTPEFRSLRRQTNRLLREAVRTRADSARGILAKLRLFYHEDEVRELDRPEFDPDGRGFTVLDEDFMHSIWHDLKHIAEKEAQS